MIAENIAGAKLHVISGVGHQPNVEAADEVSAILRTHLQDT